jgi:carboxypeptidase C (cathepsin A)
MQTRLFLLVILSFLHILVYSQSIGISIDTIVSTNHLLVINGQKVPYRAIAGMQPVWDETGKPVATLNYTYYKRTDITDIAKRPLMISFNGGPGSASVWMQIAYTGPKMLMIDTEGYPVQPYGVRDNPYSVLDVADILFVNPVNTGYSRTIPISGAGVKKELFFGVNADIKYLAEWINVFVSRQNRWLSPKFLIGESYGGTRVSGLAYELQKSHWMYLNGVVLVSPADYQVTETGGPVSSALNLPYFAATAWYHQMLPPDLQKKDLLEILPEVEEFSVNHLLPALTKGGFLKPEERLKIAEKIAKYSGISVKTILQLNLDIPLSFFWKELLREKNGHIIGRLDSRYTGIEKTETGITPEYHVELTSWLHAFTPAINYYMREVLNFKTDLKYNMFGPVSPWDYQQNNTRDDLRKAMNSNPFLKVFFQSGYYDGVTTYFHAMYTMWQVDPSGKMKDRFRMKCYRSGHMMYLREPDLKASNNDLREFILSCDTKGKPAKY